MRRHIGLARTHPWRKIVTKKRGVYGVSNSPTTWSSPSLRSCLSLRTAAKGPSEGGPNYQLTTRGRTAEAAAVRPAGLVDDGRDYRLGGRLRDDLRRAVSSWSGIA
jgi:hypothetical protein